MRRTRIGTASAKPGERLLAQANQAEPVARGQPARDPLAAALEIAERDAGAQQDLAIQQRRLSAEQVTTPGSLAAIR